VMDFGMRISNFGFELSTDYTDFTDKEKREEELGLGRERQHV